VAFLAGPDDTAVTADQVVRIPVSRSQVREWTVDWLQPMLEAFAAGAPAGAATAWHQVLDQLPGTIYESLIRPLHDRLRQRYPDVRRLTLFPSQGLGLLPLHTAWYRTDDGQRRYWMDDYAIAIAPSAQVLDRCLERAGQSPGPACTLLAVQNPDENLPFADWEVESVAGHFPAAGCLIFEHARATEAAVSEHLDFGEEKLFSTHGFSNPVRIEDSHVLLRRGGQLRFPDILDRRCPAWLTVLSACQTGITNLDDLADESEGLPAAFLLSGSQTVVASLWPVADCSTSLLMQRLHDNLYLPDRGLPKAGALQEAQQWLRTRTYDEVHALLEDKKQALLQRLAAPEVLAAQFQLLDDEHPFAHPYFWAPFQCFGAGWPEG
jgi:CHAT domain-containing protein